MGIALITDDLMAVKFYDESILNSSAKLEQAATIRCYCSAHRTSWPKWSFI